MRSDLSDVELLRNDDFLPVGRDPEAEYDLFAVPASRQHRLPTMIASQSRPAYWVEALPVDIPAFLRPRREKTDDIGGYVRGAKY